MADIFDDELYYIAMSGEMFGEMTVCKVKGCEKVDAIGFQYCIKKIWQV